MKRVKKADRHFLSVNLSGKNNKFFIMDNSIREDGKPYGQVPGTPYFDYYKDALIAMSAIDADNIYSISQKDYEILTSNR